MNLVGLRTIVLDVNFSTHGVPATVTRPAPDDTPIDTRVIWMVAGSEQLPSGAGFGRVGPTQLLALRRDEVPTVPIGTVILAPPPGSTVAVGWVVDGIDVVDGDHVHANVLRAQEYDS